MISLNSKYLEINRKIDKLKSHIKFLINNYTYHNEKDPIDIIKAYESHLSDIQIVYDEFTENCEQFENVICEAEQLSQYFDKELKQFIDKLDLNAETIGKLDEDLAFLNEEPTILALRTGIKLNSPASSESFRCQVDINISGMQFMNDSVESITSPDDTIFISKNNQEAGLATPMVKSVRKKPHSIYKKL